ncbi:IPT/TIG domain-containing protein [Stenotrophomonas rhizophila]|uniref:IPT/TIG domain-containing protein n=1 Tax=Stenotrophomonas rhizophila TaxID=216778 RepID=UPI002A6A55AA|nr:IPT/TIG domain-containing protein [Stenotrophomonas rhizophila]MDY0953962.1 IPT/TIG domain-containing protein [Stenotrophomonas rhizophila]
MALALSRVEASAMPRVLPFCNALRSDSSCYWRFAGIPATVVSGSVGELLVLVPAGAVTGPISVTVGSQSVASSTDFVVDQNAQQPRIDAIAPDVVNAGATVTVTGGSLYPIPYQTTARIGARAGVVGSVQNTQLAFVVPTLAASGKVSVSTPYGMASSAQDLVVLPSGISPAHIAGVRRAIPDAPGSMDAVHLRSDGRLL